MATSRPFFKASSINIVLSFAMLLSEGESWLSCEPPSLMAAGTGSPPLSVRSAGFRPHALRMESSVRPMSPPRVT